MENLLRVYQKLVTEVFPENAINDDVALSGEGASLKSIANLNSVGAANSMLHYLHIHKTKERALNRMAVHNIEKWMRNEYDRNLYKAERNLLLSRILIKKAFIKEGTAILQSTYKTVCKYQHTAYSLLYAHELCMRYAIAGREKHYYNFERALSLHFANLKSETISLQAYYKTISLLANKWDVSDIIIRKVGQLWNIIKKEKSKCDTHVNLTCYYRVGIYYCQIAEKYSEVVKLSKDFEYYLKRNFHLIQDGRIAEIAHYLVNACIAQRKFSKGIKYVKHYAIYFNKNNINRISFMELYAQLLLHAGNYSSALELYNEVTSTSLFKKATAVKKETWLLYKAYIDFALWDSNTIRSFRPARFLNLFENISRDKQGLNFEMLVIAFVYKLVRGQTDDLYNFSSYFEGYVRRNIKRKDYFRSYYFSKMLQLVFKYNFNYAKVESIGEKFLKKLEDNPNPKRKDKKIIEIIPYEKLWEMVIKLLREKKKELALVSL